MSIYEDITGEKYVEQKKKKKYELPDWVQNSKPQNAKKQNKIIKKSSLLDDGYDFGDFTRTAAATIADASANILGKGFLGTIEGTIDKGRYLLGSAAKGSAEVQAKVWDFLGNEAYANQLRKAGQDIKDFEYKNAQMNVTGALLGETNDIFKNNWSQNLNEKSAAGTLVNSVEQGLGNMGAFVGLAGIGGLAANGAGALGASATTANTLKTLTSNAGSTFLNSYLSASGSAMSNALNAGLSEKEARGQSITSGLAEAISEQFFQGIPGLKSAGWADKLVGNTVKKYFGSATGKVALKIFDTVGESLEEAISNVLQSTFEGIRNNKNIKDIWSDVKETARSDETKEAMISALISSAIANGGSTVIKTNQKNQVIDSYAKEHNMSVQETKQLFDSIVEKKTNLEETENFSDRVELEENISKELVDNLKTNNKIDLNELFNQTPNSRREIQFRFNQDEAKNVRTEKQNILANDMARLNDEKSNHELYKVVNAIQSANDTQQYHITTTEGLYEMGIVKKNSKGEYVMPDGSPYVPRGLNYKNGEIYINADVGSKSGTQAVYHEMFEGFKKAAPEQYNEFKQMVTDIIGEKNIQKEFDTYKAMYGEELTDDIRDEIINDKFGELAENQNFINRISDNRNVLEKLIDSIKNMIKYVKGTDEERQLMKLQKNLETEFAKRYKETDFSQGEGDTAYSIQGLEDYSRDDIKNITRDYIEQTLLDSDIDAQIKGLEIIGSRNRGNARADSDLDIVVELDGNDLREDDLFSALNDEHLEIDGIQVDINPILASKSGTLENYLERSSKYDKEILNKDIAYSLSSTKDSQGRDLTPQQQEYFKDSKVVDENGNLLEVYHGQNSEHYTYRNPGNKFNNDFASNKMFEGTEITMFTSSEEIADSYIDNEDNPNMKPVKAYLNITNPYIVDAKNQSNQYFLDNDGTPTNVNNLVKKIYDSGKYDGVIIKNVADIGEYYEADITDGRQYATDYIVFNSNQIKNVDNTNPTSNEDIRYSLTTNKDSNGKALTKEQQEYFKDTKIVDNKGNLLEVYRGEPTIGKTTYESRKGGGNKEINEYGIYFTNSKDFAKDFAFERISDPDDIFFVKKGKEGEVKSAYLNITNPLDLGTITEEEIRNLYPYESSMARQLYDEDKFVSDMLHFQEIGNHQLMKSYLDMKAIADNTDYDGLVAKLDVQGDEIEYAVFNSNQIKSTDNLNPTSNEDIRYSLAPTKDNTGKELTKEQQNFFKNVSPEVRDENGNLMRFYHGGNSDNTTFDRTKGGLSNSNASVGIWFTPSKEGAKNFVDSIWYGEDAEGKKTGRVLETYLNITNPKIYETYDNTETRNRLKSELDNAYQERKKLIDEYSWETPSLSNVVSYMSYMDDQKLQEGLVNNFHLREDRAKQYIEDAKKYIELDQKYKDIEKQFDDARWTDSYEQFRTDIYKLAGKSADDANTGGTGMSLDNKEQYIEQYVNQLKDEGYDGIVIKNTVYDSNTMGGTNTQYVVFDSNQIKNVDNLNPTDNPDIRYSLTTNKDSTGRELSPKQQEYFRDTKVVDENGNLLLMHNGRYSNDTVFKPSRWTNEKNGPTQIKGYFASDSEYSEIYGNVSDYYLNIKNPLYMGVDGQEAFTLDEWQQFFEEHGITGVEFDSSLYGPNTKGNFPAKNGKPRYLAFEIVDSDEYWNGDGNVTERIKAAGYDGLTWTEGGIAYMPFESNQIKNVDNLNPTEDDDIRNSLTSNQNLTPADIQPIGSTTQNEIAPIREDISNLNQKIDNLSNQLQTLQNGAETSPNVDIAPYNQYRERAIAQNEANKAMEEIYKDENYWKSVEEGAEQISNLDEKSAKKMSRNIGKELGLKQKQIKDLQGIIQKAFDSGYSTQEIRNELDMQFGHATVMERNDEAITAQRMIRDYKINVSKDIQKDISDYGYWKQQYFGKINFSSSGDTVSSVYQQLNAKNPAMFPSDIVNDTDQLMRIAEVADMQKKYAVDYEMSPEMINEAANYISDTIQETLYANAMRSQADLEKNAMQYNERTKEIPYKKKTKKQSVADLQTEMGITVDDLQVGNDIKSMDFQLTTPERVNEKVFGREVGRKINEQTVFFAKHQEAERIRFLNRELKEIADLGIKARSKESALVQQYGEGLLDDVQLAQAVSDKATQEKIKNAARVLRSKYDTYLDQINEELVEMGYDPIPKRKDYMRHFQELTDKFSQAGIPFNRQALNSENLPTDINGLTEFNVPGKNWFASAQRRTGEKTTYDAITGIDGYLQGASNLMYHTETIQRYRALEKLIRDTYGQQHGLDVFGDDLTSEQAMQRIADIQEGKLSNYAAWLKEQGNAIAGKKAVIDRGFESFFGRRAYTLASELKKQVGSNMTGFNVRSALTNFISSTIAASKTNKMAMVKGTVDTIRNMFNDDGFIDKSDFLTSRLRSDTSISKKTWQKISNAGQILMSGSDWFTSNLITRSKYYEGIQKGMTEDQAMNYANDFGARVMGDRSKGATAGAFNSKTLGFLTQFQLETNNQWQYMIHDTKMEYQENMAKEGGLKAGATVLFQVGQLAAYSYLFNEMFEQLTGSRAAFDILDIIKKLFGLDDDDKDKPFEERMQEAASELMDALPFTSLFGSGGRLPIGEMLTPAQTFYDAFVGNTNKYGQKTTWKDFGKDVKETIPYYVLPTGYGQIKKTAKGLGMYANEVPGSYTDSGNLRFTADTDTGSVIKNALFGQWSGDEAKKYRESGYKTIRANDIQEMQDLGMKSSEYREYKNDLKEAGSKNADKLDYINSLDIPINQKNIMASNVVDRPVDMSNYTTYEEFDFAYKNPGKYQAMKAIANNYKDYQTYMDGIEAVRDTYSQNKGYSTEQRKQKVVSYVNSLDLTIPQKAMLLRQYYSSYKKYNKEIVNYVSSLDIEYQEKVEILQSLKFKVDDEGNVSW